MLFLLILVLLFVVFNKYGDDQCPHCGEAYYIVNQLQQRLNYQFCKYFPLKKFVKHTS